MDDKRSYDELVADTAKAKGKVTLGGLYRHYKGGDYHAVGFAVAEVDNAILVIYEPILHPGIKFARPLSEWVEIVAVDDDKIPRFRLVTD